MKFWVTRIFGSVRLRSRIEIPFPMAKTTRRTHALRPRFFCPVTGISGHLQRDFKAVVQVGQHVPGDERLYGSKRVLHLSILLPNPQPRVPSVESSPHRPSLVTPWIVSTQYDMHTMRGLGYLPLATRHATYLGESGLGKRARDRKISAVDVSSR